MSGRSEESDLFDVLEEHILGSRYFLPFPKRRMIFLFFRSVFKYINQERVCQDSEGSRDVQKEEGDKVHGCHEQQRIEQSFSS